MENSITNVNERLESLKNKINGGNEEAVNMPQTENVETQKPKKEQEKKEKEKLSIEIAEPDAFPAHEVSGYVRSITLAASISEMLRSIFVDYQSAKVYWNPTLRTVGCTVRFKYCTQEEIQSSQGREQKCQAVKKVIDEIEASSETSKIIKMFSNNNNIAKNNKYAVLSKAAKEYLHDIVPRHNGKIEWESITNTSIGTVQNVSGKNISMIYLDVAIDINNILFKIYSGSPTSKDWNRNKKYTYSIQFVAPNNSYNPAMMNTASADIILKVTREDRGAMTKFCNETGFCSTPISTWM